MRAMLLLSAALLTGCTVTNGDGADSAAEMGTDSQEKVAASGRTPGYNPDRNAYFGDLHIHTRNSFDAYIFNVRATPDDAYRFARGEALTHPSGYDIQLSGPPLDFISVTDHGAYLGILPAMDDPSSPLSKLPIAADMFGTDPLTITRAFQRVGASVRSGVPLPG
ncbi:MAG: DUF3604 domain-containing protein, partial [Pseudomonadota bacterium]